MNEICFSFFFIFIFLRTFNIIVILKICSLVSYFVVVVGFFAYIKKNIVGSVSSNNDDNIVVVVVLIETHHTLHLNTFDDDDSIYPSAYCCASHENLFGIYFSPFLHYNMHKVDVIIINIHSSIHSKVG